MSHHGELGLERVNQTEEHVLRRGAPPLATKEVTSGLVHRFHGMPAGNG
ncbi:Hypothetical protein A7982_06102 [Minicystis rosea]|nr:Hypothetical protein A7982_06102 [Minicystis rosea]